MPPCLHNLDNIHVEIYSVFSAASTNQALTEGAAENSAENNGNGAREGYTKCVIVQGGGYNYVSDVLIVYGVFLFNRWSKTRRYPVNYH